MIVAVMTVVVPLLSLLSLMAPLWCHGRRPRGEFAPVVVVPGEVFPSSSVS